MEQKRIIHELMNVPVYSILIATTNIVLQLPN